MEEYWWRRNVSRRWARDVAVKDLTGCIMPINDQTIGGCWMHFIGKPDNRFMVRLAHPITPRQWQILQSAHAKVWRVSFSADSYRLNLKQASLEL